MKPFETPLREVSLAGRTVAEWQALARSAAGAHPVEVASNVICTAGPIEELAELATQFGAARLAVVPGALHHAYGFTGRVDAVVGRGHPVTLPLDLGGTIDIHPQPGRMAEGFVTAEVPELVWAVDHWSDLVVASEVLLGIRTRSLEPARAEGVEVHPTAVVENAVLGAGVRVGPLAVVRNSILGDGAVVDAQAFVDQSAIGAGSVVQNGAQVCRSSVGENTIVSFHTAVRRSVLVGDSTMSATVVARSVVGRGTFLSRGVRIAATRLTDEPIVVGGRSFSLMGVAIGDGARIGDGVALPAGYEVPAGYYLASRPVAPVAADQATETPLIEIDGRFRRLGFARKEAS